MTYQLIQIIFQPFMSIADDKIKTSKKKNN